MRRNAARSASGVSPHGVPASAGSAPSEPSPSPRGEGRGEGNRDIHQPATHDEPSDAVTDTSRIENQKSKIKNPSSPLPSRPCESDTPAPARVTRPTKNRKPKIDNLS